MIQKSNPAFFAAKARDFILKVSVVLCALNSQTLLAGGDAQNYPQAIEKEDFNPVDKPLAQLGQQLFFDKILSGNRNTSCASCHHPNQSGQDALSLGLGEGAIGLGLKRQVVSDSNKPKRRLPRNTPALYNLGHPLSTRLFHDGRVQVAPNLPSGFQSPAADALPEGLNSVLAVQALLPMTSSDEMAGHRGENLVADMVKKDLKSAWFILARRVANTERYWPWFKKAYPHLNDRSQIDITDIANAIAQYIDMQWRSTESPYDRYLRGDTEAISPKQLSGLSVFFNEGKCVRCHSGPLLSDNRFYNIGLPAFGPGKENSVDLGRWLVTNNEQDRFAFRTPPLRNWIYTAPYGHNGAYKRIEAIIDQHLSPVKAAENWNMSQTVMPKNAKQLTTNDREIDRSASASHDLPSVQLSDQQLSDLLAFMQSLNDPSPRARFGLLQPPKTVPSGIPVDR